MAIVAAGPRGDQEPRSLREPKAWSGRIDGGNRELSPRVHNDAAGGSGVVAGHRAGDGPGRQRVTGGMASPLSPVAMIVSSTSRRLEPARPSPGPPCPFPRRRPPAIISANREKGEDAIAGVAAAASLAGDDPRPRMPAGLGEVRLAARTAGVTAVDGAPTTVDRAVPVTGTRVPVVVGHLEALAGGSTWPRGWWFRHAPGRRRSHGWADPGVQSRARVTLARWATGDWACISSQVPRPASVGASSMATTACEMRTYVLFWPPR